jgi:Family of unknown function (DUF5694)
MHDKFEVDAWTENRLPLYRRPCCTERVSAVRCGPFHVGAVEKDQPKGDFLFLGSYHMNNHGLDVANIAADDVLSPTRQHEVAAVIRILEDYRPTKVMIEVRQEKQKNIDRDLAASCKGQHPLSSEEYEQIGFRLACVLHHERLYAVNWDESSPPKDIDYEKSVERNNQQRSYQAWLAGVKELVRDDQRVLRAGTVSDMLNHLNSRSWLAQNAAIYHRLGLLGTQDDPTGANWVQYWFGRNLMIFNRIVRETNDGDRVLVIFGAGHGNHLRQFAKDSGVYRIHDFPPLPVGAGRAK